MSFDTLSYILFLPLSALIYRFLPGRMRGPFLLAASFFFYACWSLPYCLLLAFVILVSYISGRLIEERRGKAGVLLPVCVFLCIGLLAFFKYFPNLRERLGILLPVGISFYTFQAVSYVADVYRKRMKAERNIFRYALFLSFFPQLVAGPIERAGNLLPQLGAGKTPQKDDYLVGIGLLISGFYRKVVLADFVSRFADAAFAVKAPEGSTVLLGSLFFGLQIYCDFAGYSEIAAGSARLFGIRLMRNFDRPYLSGSLTQFWRRWHISLSGWFTDYVYIPLGGSRKGALRQMSAILIVFSLSGIWHGAGLHFLVWGLLHGVLLGLEKVILPEEPGKGRGRLVRTVLVFVTVSLLWIFFRAEGIGQAVHMCLALLGRWNLREGLAALSCKPEDIVLLVLSLIQLPLLEKTAWSSQAGERKAGTTALLILAIFLAWMLRLGQNAPNAFIYFQF